MSFNRLREIRNLKRDVNYIDDQVSDTIFFLVDLNLLAFFSLALAVTLMTIMIYDKAFIPLTIIGITEPILLLIIFSVKNFIRKDIPSLLKEEEVAKKNLYNYKHGIISKKKSKSLTNKEIESYIDVKTVNEIYNELQQKKMMEIKKQKEIVKQSKEVKSLEPIFKIESNKKVSNNKIVITPEMVDRINKLFEEDKKVSTKVTPEMVDQINALFKNDNFNSKHKIEVKESGFVKKMGVRR